MASNFCWTIFQADPDLSLVSTVLRACFSPKAWEEGNVRLPS